MAQPFQRASLFLVGLSCLAVSLSDLATGRQRVMLSRHRAGLVVVSRDHVGETLAAHAPVADQAPGAEDANGRGRAQHTAAWRRFEANGRVAWA